MAEQKTCSRCGQAKPVGNFHRNISRRDGLAGQCKACVRANNRKYYVENREKVLDKVRKYRAENPENREAHNDRVAKWRAKNRDKVRATWRKYYAKNRDNERVRCAKYKDENREKVLARAVEYKYENPEKVRLWRSSYYTRNREKVLSKGKKYQCDSRDALSDAYVRHALTNHDQILKVSDVPQELVELKRAQLKLKRELKRRRHD